jgi:hypothetical protein
MTTRSRYFSNRFCVRPSGKRKSKGGAVNKHGATILVADDEQETMRVLSQEASVSSSTAPNARSVARFASVKPCTQLISRRS